MGPRLHVNVDHVATLRPQRGTTYPDPTAQIAGELQLRLGAGHGLDHSNVDLVGRLPRLEELNIGHGLIARGLMLGLERAVAELRALISSAAESAAVPARGAAPLSGAR